jgi:hypothetical protein
MPYCHFFSRNKIEFQLIRTHQLLVYADCVNLMGKHMKPIKQNTEVQIEANKKVGMEVNAEKTKYMAVLTSHQNADRVKITMVGWFPMAGY